MNVKDPEIDSVSIIDLGMVNEVTIEGENVRITLLPTFLGCPALEFIKTNITLSVLLVSSSFIIMSPGRYLFIPIFERSFTTLLNRYDSYAFTNILFKGFGSDSIALI